MDDDHAAGGGQAVIRYVVKLLTIRTEKWRATVTGLFPAACQCGTAAMKTGRDSSECFTLECPEHQLVGVGLAGVRIDGETQVTPDGTDCWPLHVSATHDMKGLTDGALSGECRVYSVEQRGGAWFALWTTDMSAERRES